MGESYTILSSTPTGASCAHFAAIKIAIWGHANGLHSYHLSGLDVLRLERRSGQSIHYDSSQLSAFSCPPFALTLLDKDRLPFDGLLRKAGRGCLRVWLRTRIRLLNCGWRAVRKLPDAMCNRGWLHLPIKDVLGFDISTESASPIGKLWHGLLDQVKALLRVQVTLNAVLIHLPILLEIRGDNNPCEWRRGRQSDAHRVALLTWS